MCAGGQARVLLGAGSSARATGPLRTWWRAQDVVTPLLCLNNEDDPFIPDELPDAAGTAALTSNANPHIIAARTKRGGHLGWLQVRQRGARAHPWALAGAVGSALHAAPGRDCPRCAPKARDAAVCTLAHWPLHGPCLLPGLVRAALDGRLHG